MEKHSWAEEAEYMLVSPNFAPERANQTYFKISVILLLWLDRSNEQCGSYNYNFSRNYCETMWWRCAIAKKIDGKEQLKYLCCLYQTRRELAGAHKSKCAVPATATWKSFLFYSFSPSLHHSRLDLQSLMMRSTRMWLCCWRSRRTLRGHCE